MLTWVNSVVKRIRGVECTLAIIGTGGPGRRRPTARLGWRRFDGAATTWRCPSAAATPPPAREMRRRRARELPPSARAHRNRRRRRYRHPCRCDHASRRGA
eukprot:2750666-Pyramimonas_sp.AAC.2